MFRKKYDVSDVMAKSFPGEDTGVKVIKFSTSPKSGDDSRSEKSYTNVGFVGDESGSNRQIEPNDTSNLHSGRTHSQEVELEDVSVKESANREGDEIDATSANMPSDVSDKVEMRNSNNDVKAKDQDAGFHEPEAIPDSEDNSLKRSYSLGDRPSTRDKNLQTNAAQWSVDKYASSQRAFSCGDKSSSTETAYSEDAWRLSLEDFTSKRQGSKRKDRKFSKEMRSFYKSQDNLINQYEEIRLELDDEMENAETQKELRKKASFYAKVTFVTNLVLLAIKVVAVVLSGSISLISSLVDSAVDLLSGLVIWVTTRAVKKTDRYVYPQGRTKLEPMAIVILSVIMSVASLQIIKEAFTKIIGLADSSDSPPVMDWITVGISSVTVIVKLILYLLCRRVPHPTVLALALDHRNDVMSNFVAIVFGYIGSQEMQTKVNTYGLVYLDPIGAILISIYIIANWIIAGWDQIKLLVGHTATSDFISKITWICVDHHKKVEKVDTVRAFHFGNNFLVEVDIVLSPDMTLRESHDIAEPLQQKLERLPNVERAFVHVDYEFTHDPKSEHKVV